MFSGYEYRYPRTEERFGEGAIAAHTLRAFETGERDPWACNRVA